MTHLDMKALARKGAESRVAELVSELSLIHSEFPDLVVSSPLARATRPARQRRTARATGRRMTAAQKQAVSARMTKYWAARRKQGLTSSKARSAAHRHAWNRKAQPGASAH